MLLTVLQIMVSALLFWVLAFATEGVRDVRELLDWQTAWPLLYLGLIASMLGFLVQNVGQKYLSPNTASILLSFESVFGLIFFRDFPEGDSYSQNAGRLRSHVCGCSDF